MTDPHATEPPAPGPTAPGPIAPGPTRTRDRRDEDAPEPDASGTTATATARPGPWLGVAPASRWRAVYAASFLAVLAVGFAATLANPALRDPPDAPVWDGRWAEAYQAALDADSPLLAPARTAWGLIDTGLFRQGRPGVLIGRDGWLFPREEYAAVPDAAAAIERWSERIERVRGRLDAAGATLVVAPVPAKARIVAHAAPSPLPSGAERRYDAFLAALERREVVVADLRPALSRDPEAAYLRTDTHWTPAGAEAAADAIAATIRTRTAFAGAGEERFLVDRARQTERPGDLLPFLDLGPFTAVLGPPPDRVAVPTTVPAEPAGNDLFAEVRLPLTLVGTSYSADPAWDLPGALRRALGADLVDASLSGLGPWEPMRRYLEGEALRTSPPEVVVWEIPERYLTVAEYVPDGASW